MITKYLNPILDKDNARMGLTPEMLCVLIATVILENPELLGTSLPTQHRLAEKLVLSLALIKQTTPILAAEDWGVITARPKRGMVVLSILTAEHEQLIRKQIAKFTDKGFAVLLDRAVPLEENKKLAREVKKLRKDTKTLPLSEQRQIVNDGLLPALARLTAGKLNCKVAFNEVYYADDYIQVLKACCDLCAPPKSTVYILTPVFKCMYEAMASGKRKAMFTAGTDWRTMMDELKETISSGVKISVVYIGRTGPLPMLYGEEKPDWQELYALQALSGFVILLDDNFTGTFERPDPDDFNHPSAARVVFIHRITPPEHLVKGYAVVAAAPFIAQLEEKLRAECELQDLSICYTILELVKQNLNGKLEIEGYPHLKEVIAVAQTTLLDEGTFVAAHLENQSGYLFYLEPAKGRFPKNIREKLKHARIHIIHKDAVMYGAQLKDGIIISVVSSDIAKQAGINIKKLITFLNKI